MQVTLTEAAKETQVFPVGTDISETYVPVCAANIPTIFASWSKHVADGNFIELSHEALGLMTESQQLAYYKASHFQMRTQICQLNTCLTLNFPQDFGREVEGRVIGTEGACQMAIDLLNTLPGHRLLEKQVDEFRTWYMKNPELPQRSGACALDETRQWVDKMQAQPYAGEALFGFIGWLTSRDEVSTFGANVWATPAVDMVAEFVKANNIGHITMRPDWAEKLVHPTWTVAEAYPEAAVPGQHSETNEVQKEKANG